MATHIFGIRHHGPGSARSLRNALEVLEPDCILVEGPPDAEAVLPLLIHAEMQPPVALLLYMPDEPAQSVYYPFATYSPEWQAMDYGLKRNLPVRFMDLPQCHRMALERAEGAAATQPEGALERSPITPIAPPGNLPQTLPESVEEIDSENPAEALPASEGTIEIETTGEVDPEAFAIQVRRDPLNWIAEAAGYSDGESWWEHMVEQRRDSADLFQGVQEVMAALREASPPDPDPQEALREAWMRQTIRAAEKEGFQCIAVVCGAWHGPALVDLPPAKTDADLLKGLPKAKVAATWVPWTYGRLTMASGYGAGVMSPAWYEHLWHHSDRVIVHWMTMAARLFRAEDLPASPASVIEAVRLAETLAAVRERPLPGLPELWEAAQSIFCYGSETPMRLIQEKLIVGEKLGHVPDETPMLPIQQDLRKEQRRLRLAPEAAHSDKDFDQRDKTDLERSYLLHRLNLLGVPWGQVQESGRGKGTFHELWRMQWHPEFEVKLIEANVWGNTVRAAAARRVQERAAEAKELAQLTRLVGPTLWADLGEAVDALMGRLENMAAITSDTLQLMEALPDLAELAHRGDVRKTDKGLVSQVVNGLIVRICIGLPAACAALNDEAAAALFPRLMATHSAIKLPENGAHLPVWHATLERLADQAGLHGLIAGRCCYLLLDQHIWETEEVGRRLNLALSLAEDPAQAAAWIEGLLRESGELLVHTDSLWPILDGWVERLPAEVFVQLLPLLRRTFSEFPSGLRRQLGERAKGGAKHTRGRVAETTDLDVERAERAPASGSAVAGSLSRKRKDLLMTQTDLLPAGSEAERLRRWRLILGGNEADGTDCKLEGMDVNMDRTLQALYQNDTERKAGLGGSAPNVARWLGDIRTYFPSSIVRVMQQDAFERLGLEQMLLQPEMLEAVEPDIHLVATLLSLTQVMPSKTKETARQVIRKVVEELEKKLANPLRQAVTGSLNRATRNRRPKHNEIDWNRTIRANLRHYQQDLNTIIPESRIGYGRKGQALREIVLCIDQSGSMATSVVYSSILGAVLASIKAVKTSVVVFDTAVVDLSDLLHDPVEVLFGTQLGGGTDINRALSYCQGLIRNPHDTILVLISDLYEGGNQQEMLARAATIAQSGVQMIALLALDDRGAPSFDHNVAAHFAEFGIPSFACTPDLFPDMMANAIKRQDLTQWAAGEGIVVARAT